MLETINLSKTYKPKKGVPVKALDRVSLRFPEKGMVFLLGKSGSGKSTLLNVLGGLDRYDSGEIIIKGVSSKNFRGSHFDSYRNTYVGFIFQSYNLLDEFTVGANIGLALELQGKKATNEAINEILRELDLEGYGARRPNELSGGQLQRVAIARALVKKPEIIMADEPSGALDSKTGRQIFETLKKLSKNTLVIVVSHDREFAENYADRIIELSDGRVISDIELKTTGSDGGDVTEAGDSPLTFGDRTVEIAGGYMLTEEDRIKINEYLAALHSGKLNINVSENERSEERESKNIFVPTDTDKIPRQDSSSFKLIKSRLPIKNAIKIGASGLKYKKFRLVMTILLSVVAFVLFGLADTFASYNHINACTDSIIDTGVSYLALEKNVQATDYSGEIFYSSGYRMSADEIKTLSKESGHALKGVYSPKHIEMSVSSQADLSYAAKNYLSGILNFNGFINLNQADIDELGYSVTAGKLPDGNKNEIAISKCIADIFLEHGFTEQNKLFSLDEDEIIYEKFESYDGLIGKKLFFEDTPYTITGIVDTLFDREHYKMLFEDISADDIRNMTNAENILYVVLHAELQYEINYSCVSCAIVGDGFIERLVQEEPIFSDEIILDFHSYGEGQIYEMYGHYQYTARYSDLSDSIENAVWFDGSAHELKDNEVLINIDQLYGYYADQKTSYSDMPDSLTREELIEVIKRDPVIDVYVQDQLNYNYYEKEFKIAGYFELNYDDPSIYETDKYKYWSSLAILSDSLYDSIAHSSNDGIYSRAIGVMPKDKADIRELVKNSVREDTEIRYELENAVTFQLDLVNEVLKVLSQVFFYIGIVLAVFAALLMSNFISVSVTNKKHEIGILRAIGSRSNDVFRIFFSESFIIATINFVLSIGISSFAIFFINSLLRDNYNLLVTPLHFGMRQGALLFAICLAVAVVASYLPVRHIAAKRPIDAIKKN